MTSFKECSPYAFFLEVLVSVLYKRVFVFLIQFEFIFVDGMIKCSDIIIFHIAVQFFKHHIEETVFSTLYILSSFVID